MRCIMSATSGCPTDACHRLPWGCPPAAPVEGSNSPRTAGSRACRGFRRGRPELRNRLPVYASRPLVGLHFLEGFPDLPLRDVERLCRGHATSPVTGWPPAAAVYRSPFGPAPLQGLRPYYGLLRLCARIGTLALAGASHLSVSLNIGTTGSRVPQQSLIQVHPASKPGAARAGLQGSAQTHPGGHYLPPGFETVL
jgi:hypothetical protein